MVVPLSGQMDQGGMEAGKGEKRVFFVSRNQDNLWEGKVLGSFHLGDPWTTVMDYSANICNWKEAH